MTATSEFSARALKWLRDVSSGAVLHLRVDAAPAPASRPRVFGNGGVTYSKSYQEFQRACQTQIATARVQGHGQEGAEQASGDQVGWPLQGPLCAVLDVACARPRTSRLSHPRGDVDNYAKGPLDACTKSGVWADDAAVRTLWVNKRWVEAGETPGISLWIAAIS